MGMLLKTNQLQNKIDRFLVKNQPQLVISYDTINNPHKGVSVSQIDRHGAICWGGSLVHVVSDAGGFRQRPVIPVFVCHNMDD